MPRLFLIPKKDTLIPDPATRPSRPLPEAGGWVEASDYWQRRLVDEDVTDDTADQLKREQDAEDAATATAKGEAEADGKKSAKAKPTTTPVTASES